MSTSKKQKTRDEQLTTVIVTLSYYYYCFLRTITLSCNYHTLIKLLLHIFFCCWRRKSCSYPQACCVLFWICWVENFRKINSNCCEHYEWKIIANTRFGASGFNVNVSVVKFWIFLNEWFCFLFEHFKFWVF